MNNNKIYLIDYNNKIIGVYSDFTLLELFINSLYINQLINNEIKIIEFIDNSICSTKLFKYNIKHNNKHNNDNINIKQEKYDNLKNDNTKIEEFENINSPIDKKEVEKLSQQKIDLIHNINILNTKKQRMKELEIEFNSDVKLYNKFNNIMLNNKSFEIPQLFLTKYNIIKELDELNNLNYNAYINLYNKINPDTTMYDNLF